MSIKSFPTEIPLPSYPLKMVAEDNSITSKFEDGSMVSRKKFSRSRIKFEVQWNSLTNEEFAILDNFIVNVVSHAAEAFVWENPVNHVPYTVRCTSYSGGTLTFFNNWNVQIELTEV